MHSGNQADSYQETTREELIEELLAWYDVEPTGPHWALLGKTIRFLILGMDDDPLRRM